MRFFSFSLLIGAGALLGHLYLYRRLVRKLAPGRAWRRGLGLLLAALTVLLFLRRPIRDLGPRVEQVYEVLAYSWMAVALCMIVALALGDALELVVTLAQRLRSSPVPAGAEGDDALSAAEQPHPAPRSDNHLESPGRRGLLKAIPWGVVAGGGITAGYGSYQALTAPEVTEVVVPLAKLPRALEGLSIVQLTDVHVGSFIRQPFLEMLVASANAEKPDLVAITGDLVDGDVRTLGAAVGTLAKLRSRYGSYFVTGNHEYYSGELPWVRFLDELGITVLRNARLPVGDAGGRIDLVGVDDFTGGRRRGRQGYDLDKALMGRDPDRAAVLLAHQPENFQVAAARGVDLQISGHTHGGQVFPMTELVRLRYPYHRGMYRHGEGRLYVSRGCGFWGPPSRIGSPPELVKYVLVQA